MKARSGQEIFRRPEFDVNNPEHAFVYKRFHRRKDEVDKEDKNDDESLPPVVPRKTRKPERRSSKLSQEISKQEEKDEENEPQNDEKVTKKQYRRLPVKFKPKSSQISRKSFSQKEKRKAATGSAVDISKLWWGAAEHRNTRQPCTVYPDCNNTSG